MIDNYVANKGDVDIDTRFWLQNTTRRCEDFPAKRSLDLVFDKTKQIPLQQNYINSQK